MLHPRYLHAIIVLTYAIITADKNPTLPFPISSVEICTKTACNFMRFVELITPPGDSDVHNTDL